MNERPVVFTPSMVRAQLDGRKTQLRLVVKLPHQNPLGKWEVFPWGGPSGGKTRNGKAVPLQDTISHTRTGEIIGCPHGEPGNRLWVKENYRVAQVLDSLSPKDLPNRIGADGPAGKVALHFEADGGLSGTSFGRLRRSTSMCRWMSRITLEITGVRVERLQDISEADAKAEGCLPVIHADGAIDCGTRKTTFRTLWESINGPGSWAANPWVWVIEFKNLVGDAA